MELRQNVTRPLRFEDEVDGTKFPAVQLTSATCRRPRVVTPFKGFNPDLPAAAFPTLDSTSATPTRPTGNRATPAADPRSPSTPCPSRASQLNKASHIVDVDTTNEQGGNKHRIVKTQDPHQILCESLEDLDLVGARCSNSHTGHDELSTPGKHNRAQIENQVSDPTHDQTSTTSNLTAQITEGHGRSSGGLDNGRATPGGESMLQSKPGGRGEKAESLFMNIEDRDTDSAHLLLEKINVTSLHPILEATIITEMRNLSAGGMFTNQFCSAAHLLDATEEYQSEFLADYAAKVAEGELSTPTENEIDEAVSFLSQRKLPLSLLQPWVPTPPPSECTLEDWNQELFFENNPNQMSTPGRLNTWTPHTPFLDSAGVDYVVSPMMFPPLPRTPKRTAAARSEDSDEEWSTRPRRRMANTVRKRRKNAGSSVLIPRTPRRSLKKKKAEDQNEAASGHLTGSVAELPRDGEPLGNPPSGSAPESSKKKRGRPPKKETKAATALTSSLAVNSQDQPSVPSKPKPRRKRLFKKSELTSMAATAAQPPLLSVSAGVGPDVTPQGESSRAPPRKRRSRKPLLATSDIIEGTTETQVLGRNAASLEAHTEPPTATDSFSTEVEPVVAQYQPTAMEHGPQDGLPVTVPRISKKRASNENPRLSTTAGNDPQRNLVLGPPKRRRSRKEVARSTAVKSGAATASGLHSDTTLGNASQETSASTPPKRKRRTKKEMTEARALLARLAAELGSKSGPSEDNAAEEEHISTQPLKKKRRTKKEMAEFRSAWAREAAAPGNGGSQAMPPKRRRKVETEVTETSGLSGS